MNNRKSGLMDEELNDQVDVIKQLSQNTKSVKKVQLKKINDSEIANKPFQTIKENPSNIILEKSLIFNNGSLNSENTSKEEPGVVGPINEKSNSGLDDSALGDINFFREKGRDKIIFTSEETAFLIDMEREYGNQWTKILKLGKERKIIHQKRRVIDLKNKFNQINKKTAYYKAPIKTWRIYDIDRKVIGEDSSIDIGHLRCKYKFPYSAAKCFAQVYFNDFGLNKKFIISVTDVNVDTNIHSYFVIFKDDLKVSLKKIMN